MALTRPRMLALGIAALAVTSVGIGTAAVGDVTGTAPAADTAASPAPTTTTVESPPATPSPRPTPVTMWVRPAAANVWFKTAWVRRIDRPVLAANPDLPRWVHHQTYRQRLALGRNLMTQALRGEQVVVLASIGGWDKVRLPSQRGSYYRQGIIGWIPKVQLSATPVAAAAVQQLPKRGSSIIRAARAYLGSPYIFGGMTRAGIDCSGLTYIAAEHVGIVLPRDAADQAAVGRPVSRRALRPGDLVFFGRGGRNAIHHVGIYVGHGRILHAPHTGSTVRISRLSSFHDYWGARRLVPTG